MSRRFSLKHVSTNPNLEETIKSTETREKCDLSDPNAAWTRDAKGTNNNCLVTVLATCDPETGAYIKLGEDLDLMATLFEVVDGKYGRVMDTVTKADVLIEKSTRTGSGSSSANNDTRQRPPTSLRGTDGALTIIGVDCTTWKGFRVDGSTPESYVQYRLNQTLDHYPRKNQSVEFSPILTVAQQAKFTYVPIQRHVGQLPRTIPVHVYTKIGPTKTMVSRRSSDSSDGAAASAAAAPRPMSSSSSGEGKSKRKHTDVTTTTTTSSSMAAPRAKRQQHELHTSSSSAADPSIKLANVENDIKHISQVIPQTPETRQLFEQIIQAIKIIQERLNWVKRNSTHNATTTAPETLEDMMMVAKPPPVGQSEGTTSATMERCLSLLTLDDDIDIDDLILTTAQNLDVIHELQRNTSDKLKMTLTVTAEGLAMEFFKNADVNDDGMLDENEMVKEIAKGRVFFPICADMAHRTFMELDKDHNGKISRNQFIESLKERETELMPLFDRLDKNHDGFLDLEELKDPAFLSRANITEEQLVDFVRMVDSSSHEDPDDRISRAEFLSTFTLMPSGVVLERFLTHIGTLASLPLIGEPREEEDDM